MDINCDMGESYGNFKIGNDAAVFPYITSSNIACGFHGGDPVHIRKTVSMALEYGVRIGAHPGYPDLAGFGRRDMELSETEIEAMLLYQISALQGMTQSLGGSLSYVKPHGAFYNRIARDTEVAKVVFKTMDLLSPSLPLMVLAGSPAETLAREKGRPVIAEAFADRRYEGDGQLMSRKKEGAVIHQAEQAARQVVSLALHHQLTAANGTRLHIQAQSVCIHGDNPQAIEILQAIDERFATEGIQKGYGS